MPTDVENTDGDKLLSAPSLRGAHGNVTVSQDGDSSSSHDVEMEYDDVLDAIGVGPFQYMMLVICGMGNAADAVEILSLSYILPELDLTDWEKSVLSAAVFAGMLIGGYIIGIVSDIIGRRKCLIITMLCNVVFTVAFPLTTWLPLQGLVRFGVGLGVGGAVPVVFSLALEVLPTKSRGQMLTVVAAFWMIGSIITASLAWIIIPRAGWVVFAFSCASPAAATAVLAILYCCESPRYLLTKGRVHEAEQVVIQMARANKHAVFSRGVTLKGVTSCDLEAPVKQQLLSMVSPSLRRTTFLCTFMWIGMSYGWYGIVIWMPTLLKARGVKQNLYQSAFMVAGANLPGNIISALTMDRIGRRATLVSCMFMAGISAGLLAISEHPNTVIALACVFNGISVGGWNALDIVTVELFPTSSRSTAMGVLAGVGRFSSMMAQISHAGGATDASPLISGCAVLLIGCVAAIALPRDTKGVHLQDANPDQQSTLATSMSLDMLSSNDRQPLSSLVVAPNRSNYDEND